MKYAFTYIIIFLLSNLSIAQTENIHFTLRNGYNIYQSTLVKLSADSVMISSSGKSQWIKVDSIMLIRKTRKSKFWQGAGIGLVSGAVIGGVVAKATYKKSKSSEGLDFSGIGEGINTLAGIITGGGLGFLIGGVMGSSVGYDKVYDLLNKNLDQKRKIILMIMSQERRS